MYSVFEALLKERNVRVMDVARATGIRPSTFTDWKKGVYTPKQDKLQKIAQFFDVSLDYILTGDEPQPSSPISWGMEHDQEFMDHIRILFSLSENNRNTIYSNIRFLASEEEKKDENVQKEA